MSSLFRNITLGLALLLAGAGTVPALAAAPQNMAVAAQPAAGRDIIAEIMAVVGLQPRFEVMASNEIDNAAAVILYGKRYILYDPEFLSAVNNAVQTDWAGVSILAHEIGHHLNGHTLSSRGSNHADELEADEFSGFVLRKMGASLADAQAAMSVLAEKQASATHPARADRLAHISKGWQQANVQLLAANKTNNKKAPAVAAMPAPTKPAVVQTAQLDSRYVLGRLVFDNAPENNFFITTRLNIVQAQGNNLQVVGKISETTSRQFPFVIQSDVYSALLITDSGIVVNQKGKRVGRLQQA